MRKPRVLAWAASADGVVVGLTDRLAVRAGDEWRQVFWHEIQRGGWDEEAHALRWRPTDDPKREMWVTLAQPGRLPELFRERVEQTIVLQRTVHLAPSKTAVVAARRSRAEGASGLVWTVTPSRGVDLDDPALAARAQAELDSISSVWAF